MFSSYAESGSLVVASWWIFDLFFAFSPAILECIQQVSADILNLNMLFMHSNVLCDTGIFPKYEGLFSARHLSEDFMMG